MGWAPPPFPRARPGLWQKRSQGPDLALRTHPPRFLLHYLMSNYTLTCTEMKKGFSVRQNLLEIFRPRWASLPQLPNHCCLAWPQLERPHVPGRPPGLLISSSTGRGLLGQEDPWLRPLDAACVPACAGLFLACARSFMSLAMSLCSERACSYVPMTVAPLAGAVRFTQQSGLALKALLCCTLFL